MKNLTINAIAVLSLTTALSGCFTSEKVQSSSVPSTHSCPIGFGWSEGLGQYLNPNAKMSINDTANIPTPDCAFHQWSWETFVWANALDENNIPRFMSMHSPNDLLPNNKSLAGQSSKPTLVLASRAHASKQLDDIIEGAGAIVEADGNMLVAKNGYPVYASVHMNASYFKTAQANLIKNGGYKNNKDDYFSVGAAVIKATWLRLGNGVEAPEGAFVTNAQVPVLQAVEVSQNVTIDSITKMEKVEVVMPVPNKTLNVQVALVGMHVVGYTENHPEFLWGTFEHKLNAPMIANNTFKTSGSSDKNYTFYKASTPFSEVNLPNNNMQKPVLSFDEQTGTFYPPTNVVQQNRTGGESQTNGVFNITSLNKSSQNFLKGQSNPKQADFANYNLIGTVWMEPNSYGLDSGAADAVGSITLANSTAESFFQVAKNSPSNEVKNCFSCHNASSYTFAKNPQKLKNRKIAISHVLGEGTSYAVPNVIPVKK